MRKGEYGKMKRRITLKRLARRNKTREQVSKILRTENLEKVHANEVEKRFKQYSKAIKLFNTVFPD